MFLYLSFHSYTLSSWQNELFILQLCQKNMRMSPETSVLFKSRLKPSAASFWLLQTVQYWPTSEPPTSWWNENYWHRCKKCIHHCMSICSQNLGRSHHTISRLWRQSGGIKDSAPSQERGKMRKKRDGGWRMNAAVTHIEQLIKTRWTCTADW